MSEPRELVTLKRATKMLAECRTIDEAKKIRDVAEGARVYAAKARLGRDAVQHAMEIKLRAERRCGELLIEGKARGEIAEKGRPQKMSNGTTFSLSEVGVTRDESSRWQKLARVDDFAAYVRQVVALDRTDRTARQEQARQQRKAAAAARESDGSRDVPVAVKTYQTIVVDPPWAYDRADIRGAAEHHYDTMTFDEIATYPVGDFAAKESHLYVWVTNPHLPHVWRIVEAWGFEYKTMLTWVKPQMGTGHYFRGATEHALFCTRGQLPLRAANIPNWFQANRTKHSAKPDEFYALVERASFGPYLDIFARRKRKGWDVIGDES